MSARKTLFALSLMAAPAFSQAMADEKPLPPQPKDISIGTELQKSGSLVIMTDQFNVLATALEFTHDAQGNFQPAQLPEFNMVHIRCHGPKDAVPTFNIGFHMFHEEPRGDSLGYAEALRSNAEPQVYLDENGQPLRDTVLSRSFAVTQDKIWVLDKPEDYRALLEEYRKGAWSTTGISVKENAARFIPEISALCLNVG